MNARNSALHEMLSTIADRINQAANNAAFFMSTLRKHIYNLCTYGTLDPVAKILRNLERQDTLKKNL